MCACVGHTAAPSRAPQMPTPQTQLYLASAGDGLLETGPRNNFNELRWEFLPHLKYTQQLTLKWLLIVVLYDGNGLVLSSFQSHHNNHKSKFLLQSAVASPLRTIEEVPSVNSMGFATFSP